MKRDMADRFLKPRSTMFRFRSPGLFYRWQIIRQTLSFLNRLRKDREVRRYAGRSLDEYQAYDDFEQRILRARKYLHIQSWKDEAHELQGRA
ncbi:MAG: hypothetical protein AAFS01_13795 [Pseudomonadota bacterium]